MPPRTAPRAISASPASPTACPPPPPVSADDGPPEAARMLAWLNSSEISGSDGREGGGKLRDEVGADAPPQDVGVPRRFGRRPGRAGGGFRGARGLSGRAHVDQELAHVEGRA